MGIMNKRMNLPALQKIMREFEMQNEKMEMTSEMMGDAIDDAFEGEEEEEETQNLVNQVLDEIGISTQNEMSSVPTTANLQANQQPAQQVPVAEGYAESLDSDLQERLTNLRKT